MSERNKVIGVIERAARDTKRALRDGAIGQSGTPIQGGMIQGVEHNTRLSPSRALGTSGGRPGIYQKMRLTDTQIQALLLALKLPIIGAEWTASAADSPEGESTTDAQAEEDRILVERGMFENPERDWRDTIRETLTFLDFGFCLLEKVWGRTADGKILPVKFGLRLPQTVSSWEVKNGSFAGVIQEFYNNDAKRFEKVQIPAEKLILLTHQLEGDNYAGISALRPIWPLWEIKQMLLKLLSIAFEREALGIPIAKRPEQGSTDAEDDDVEDLLYNMRAHQKAYGILPHGWELEWVFNSGGAQAREALIMAIRYLDEQMLTSYLSQFIGLGSTATGSRAVAKEHTDLFWMALNGIGSQIAAAFNGPGSSASSGVIRQIVSMNSGERERYPFLQIQAVEGKNLEDFTDAVQKLSSAGALTPDALLEEYVRTYLGVPLKPEEEKDDEETKTEPTNDPSKEEPSSGGENDASTDPPTNDPSERTGQNKLNDPKKLNDLFAGRPFTPVEQFVSFRDIIARFDSAPEELAAAVQEVLRSGYEKVRKRINTAVDERDPSKVPNTVPNLEAEIREVLLEEVNDAREFGVRTVERERARQRRGKSINPPSVRTPGPRRFADPEDPADEFRRDYEKHVAVARRTVEAQASAVASEIATQAQSQMRLAVLGAIRRGVGDLGTEILLVGEQTIKSKATGLVATALNIGRSEAAARYGSEITAVQFSAVADKRSCPQCNAEDQAVFAFGSPEHEAHECPYASCDGGAYCRCVLVFIFGRFAD